MSDIDPFIFTEAKKIIADPENWIRGNYAVNADNEMVFPTSENAVCFCTFGAVAKALNIDPGRGRSIGLWMRYEDFMTESLIEYVGRGYGDVPQFNDAVETTHRDVLNFLSFVEAKALEQAKER